MIGLQDEKKSIGEYFGDLKEFFTELIKSEMTKKIPEDLQEILDEVKYPFEELYTEFVKSLKFETENGKNPI